MLNMHLRKMGRSRHCSEEWCSLIKKLIGEGRTHKEVQKNVGCSAKMISNALKWVEKPETHGRKLSNCQNGPENNQNGKGSANDQLQDDQTQSAVTCKCCDS